MKVTNHLAPLDGQKFTGKNAFSALAQAIDEADRKRIKGLRQTQAARKARKNG